MSGAIISFLVAIFIVAVVTRDSYAFILFYLFAGAFLLSRWWVNHTSAAIHITRKFERRSFPGEKIPVELVIENKSRLPIVWIHAQESLALEISHTKILRQVFSLAPRSKDSLTYQLLPQKRGYYPVGPVLLSTGDLLGLVQEKVLTGERDYLTVYPKVIPLSKIYLPSHSPLGNLPYEQPIFDDPTRPVGKRDYSAGDSLRRIDWKSSAVVGRLQTKLFEPSIALETVLFLNLNSEEYHYKFRYDSSELAITVTASLANWIIGQKQSVGLVVNGSDPNSSTRLPLPLPPRKGRNHLMHILETLARVQLGEIQPIHTLLHQTRVNFNWGTTIIVLTGQVDEILFKEFFHLRRAGLNVVLILCGDVINIQEMKLRAKIFKIPLFSIQDEHDLDIWRR